MELKDLQIIKSDRKSFCLEVNPNLCVKLRAPRFATKKQIESFYLSHEKWLEEKLEEMKKRASEKEKTKKLSAEQIEDLKKRALEVIPKKAEMFAAVIGVTFGKITIKKQKTCWGSCSSKKNLSFNCLLMLFDERVLDYVIVHELCHLKYMNHSRSFWNEVGKYIPDYNQIREILKNQTTNCI